MLIYLIGFMGCGKSYLGKQVAQTLNYSFVDLDELIEENEQKNIAEIFAQEGETHFRYLEQKYLAQTVSRKNCVVATGGGTPCFFDNMDVINKNGVSVYLFASTKILLERLQNDKEKRPKISSLGQNELESYIKRLLDQRSVFYEKAHMKIIQKEDKNQNNELLKRAIRQILAS